MIYKNVNIIIVKTMNESCPICIENVKLIACGSCNYKACKNCIRKFILEKESEIGTCMNCNTAYTRATMVDMQGITFVKDIFTKHQHKVRINKQNKLLPSLQPIAEKEIKIENIEKEITELQKIIRQKKEDMFAIRNSRDHVQKKYIRPCSIERCNGFLNTSWICGICNIETCKDCFEPITKADHVCDPNTKETATLLKKDTKCCPKCGTGIYKIEGCFGKDTIIPLWDGSYKMVQDIIVGDIIFGDDNSKRTVIELYKGKDELYEISQKNGINYIVNSKHDLVLKNINDKKVYWDTNKKTWTYSIYDIKLQKIVIKNAKNFNDDDDIIISVSEYIKLNDVSKSYLRGFKYDLDICIYSPITVTHIGRGDYYGFRIDKNNKFILSDNTIVKNCDQMYCVCCNTAFSWKTGIIETGRIHNPHYYQHLRNIAGDQEIRREPGDELPGHNVCELDINERFISNSNSIIKISLHLKNKIEKIKPGFNMISYMEAYIDLVRYFYHIDNIRENILIKIRIIEENIKAFSVLYIRNLASKENYERVIKVSQRKREVLDERIMLITTLVDVIKEIIVYLYNNNIAGLYELTRSVKEYLLPENIKKEKSIEAVNTFISIFINNELELKNNYRLKQKEIENIINYCTAEDEKIARVFSIKSYLDIKYKCYYKFIMKEFII